MAQRDAGIDAPESHLTPPNGLAAVVLAAGKGTRMRSNLPKVLHPVLGEPMINHVLRALRGAGIPPERTAVVVGYGSDKVAAAVATQGNYLLVHQEDQLGTGHALRSAEATLTKMNKEQPGSVRHVLLVLGDGPLVTTSTLNRLIERHFAGTPLVTMVTTEAADPTGYGRIIRDEDGNFQKIIEEVELTAGQKAIREINPSLYLFQSEWLWPSLHRLQPSPQKGEYYLTDLPEMALEDYKKGADYPVKTIFTTFEEVQGINDRVQLAETEALLRRRILNEHMLAGVTITDPNTTYISATARIGTDSIIEPNTFIRGDSVIGQNCVIGPGTILLNAIIGDSCTVLASMIEHSTLENEVEVGPFSHLRPGCYLESHVHLGNFAEAKNTRLGAYTQQGHFSYMGDATVGHNVNIAAGTITANYDGKHKNQTIIGDNVFIGCDTIFRAPVTLGEDSRTGAGSVVTRDVEAGITVVGMPARPIRRKPVNTNQQSS